MQPEGARRRRAGAVITPYRVVVTLVLAVAATLTVVGFQADHTVSRSEACSSGPIVRLVPCPNDSDLRQGLIGAELSSGYDAALIVDTTEIPLDQLRTGGSNQIFFQPGPGTETGVLTPGPHGATVVYWPVTGTREHDAQSFSWRFGVT